MSASWSVLTDSERAQLRVLAERWGAARSIRDYATADSLRGELMEWGAWPPEGGWHPVFESSDHRQARIAARGEA